MRFQAVVSPNKSGKKKLSICSIKFNCKMWSIIQYIINIQKISFSVHILWELMSLIDYWNYPYKQGIIK